MSVLAFYIDVDTRVYTARQNAPRQGGPRPLKLVVTEKNIAAKKLAEILAVGKPTTDKVYNTPIYKLP